MQHGNYQRRIFNDKHWLKQCAWLLAGVVLVLAASAEPVRAERIKDLAGITGVRTNQLVGYGLNVPCHERPG